ncbi:MAG: excinuclease ABC subunit UvrA, partial [Planctomycetota bacterium]
MPLASDLELDAIQIRGAAEHNLKQVDVDIPKKRLVVFTGPSGSGKSSLAFDTIYNEGQRRYVESLSSYARQFLGQAEKPHYDSIRGLSPTIAIEQKSASKNPRSTVGTITEILDYLRVLWARVGVQHCHQCGAEVGKRSQDEIVDAILRLPNGSRLLLLAPRVRERKGEYQDLFEQARRNGFTRVLVDGEERHLDQPIALEKNIKHTIFIVIDRLIVKPGVRERLADSVEVALREGDGICHIRPALREGQAPPFDEQMFSERLYCHHCDISFNELEPNSFSFNSPVGMCHACNGLGTRAEIDPHKVIPDDSLSIDEGAIAAWGPLAEHERRSWHAGYRRESLDQLRIPRDKPWNKLTDKQRETVLYGSDRRVRVAWSSRNGEGAFNSRFEGVIPGIERGLRESESEARRHRLARFYSTHTCTACGGSRLQSASAAVRLGETTLPVVCSFTIVQAKQFFDALSLDESGRMIAAGALREVQSRLRFLLDVGLGYLSLDRSGPTLSGGEAQRIRLASQVGSELTGVLYVLDEPSIGLHQRDNHRLIQTLKHLRDIGNTVIVVEHDEDTIRAADHLVDFGPLAGELGGEIVYAGAIKGLKKAETMTADYLFGRKCIEVPEERQRGNGMRLVVRGARANNLQGIDVAIPLGILTCITGVSGAGKSSLLNQILFPALNNHFNGTE